MERLHPGVYIQEISGGARPIEGVSTSTTAIVGKTQKGSVDRPELVTNFTEFQSAYGDFLSDSFVAHAALQYFNNGGKRLYVARALPTGTPATTASVGMADRQTAPAKAMTVAALNPGAWPNTYTITVGPSTLDSDNLFRVSVSRGNDVLETFDNVGVNPDAGSFVDRAVNGRSRFVTVTTNTATTGAAATSASGFNAATSLPADKRTLVIEINNDSPRTITLSGTLDTGANIASALQAAVRALPPLRLPTGSTAYSGFAATFSAGSGTSVNFYTLTVVETGRRASVRVTSAPGAGNAAGLLKLGLANGGKEVTGSSLLRPLQGTVALSGASPIAGSPVLEATIGSDGGPVTDADLITGLTKLDAVTDVNIVAIPGRGTTAIVDAGTAYCANRGDCFYIGETGKTDDTATLAQTFVNSLTVKSSFGAVYFPWIKAIDPTG